MRIAWANAGVANNTSAIGMAAFRIIPLCYAGTKRRDADVGHLWSMMPMQIWEAITLGVVQGLTEFLPISSTAHLVVVREAMGHPHPDDAFTTVIQLGTLFAVFAYFRSDILRMLG